MERKTVTGGVQMGTLVMIVDDSAAIRGILRAVFETEGLKVCEAIDGVGAIQTASDVKPNLIVLDLSMPEMNGLEAARELKTLMPQVPLLMFTNHSEGALGKEADSAGIAAVVSKSGPNPLAQLVMHAKLLLGLDGSQTRRVS
jgi:CheY-like chemotaxis protein